MGDGITITAAPAAGKAGKYVVVSRNGVGELHRDTLDLNVADRRKKFVGATMRVAFKGKPPDDWPGEVREALEKQLAALAAVPPGSAEAGVTGVTEQPEGDEPWPTPVEGAALLDSLRDFILTYVVLPEHAAETLALWLVHTYAPDAGGGYTPYIWISSPVRECGKSTLLEILSLLAYRGQMTGGITAAALYRRIHRAQPTMLLDELDTRLRGDGGESLRGVLNTGFHRTGKMTICVGDAHEDTDFNTYCPKVLAGIGRLWDTVASRSVPVRLRRANREELVVLRKIRGDRIDAECRPYRRKLLRYARDVRDKLTVTEAVTPEELGARQCDVWRPLLAVADVTGGHWPVTARAAAVAIHKGAGDEGDYGLLLLEDLRDLFRQRGTDALFSETVVQELVKKEDRPWPEYRADKPITKNGLASLLKRFEVRPRTVRVGEETAKGYRAEDLAPVFRLYLPPLPPPNETSQPSHGTKTGTAEAQGNRGCDGCDVSFGGGTAPPQDDEPDPRDEAERRAIDAGDDLD